MSNFSENDITNFSINIEESKKKSEPKPKKAEIKVEKELKEPKTEVKKAEPKKEAEAILSHTIHYKIQIDRIIYLV